MFDIQEELKKLPDKPGVYIMKDENKRIIYVGKAVVLKNRVRQYFQASANHTPKTRMMVSKIKEFEYIVTDTELEALILENNLIKKHKPKYNILLKDDKTYPMIKITMNEDYPRVIMTRKQEKDGAKYYGPYSSTAVVRETLDLIKKLFPIKTCNRVFPRDIGKERPCLNYHIFQCLGPCTGNVDKEEYRALMKDIGNFLEGKHEDVIKRLEQQMQEAAENLEFEKAASLRNKISSLRELAESQKVVSTAMVDQDVVGFAADSTDSCIQIFFVRNGKLIGREHFIFEGMGESEAGEIIASFIKQFYGAAPHIPSEILLQEDTPERELLESWLCDKRGGRVYLKVPQRGEKHELVEMAAQNARICLDQFRDKVHTRNARTKEGLEGLAAMLGLKEPPRRIEAYDISNTGSSEIVASMVVFEEGLPANKEYRRFRIKSTDTQNDYASMQEVIFRRFRHAAKEKEELGDEAESAGKFGNMPDLILLDGGLGHVNAVEQVMSELSLDIPVFGMVKDDRHRTRGLVSADKEMDLTGNLTMLRFVTAIQDEAHRFALEYNKKLRNKRYTGSELDQIEGIGPKRKKALIKHFGSLSRIKSAELDDLMAVSGISRPVAEAIYNHFH